MSLLFTGTKLGDIYVLLNGQRYDFVQVRLALSDTGTRVTAEFERPYGPGCPPRKAIPGSVESQILEIMVPGYSLVPVAAIDGVVITHMIMAGLNGGIEFRWAFYGRRLW